MSSGGPSSVAKETETDRHIQRKRDRDRDTEKKKQREVAQILHGETQGNAESFAIIVDHNRNLNLL